MIVSIFYHRSLWRNLLMQVIKTFVSMDEKKSIGRWCIFLSGMQGDHITLAVKSHDDQLERKFSNLVTEFLETYPSEKEAIVYPLRSFFMDYPNNSIVFDKDKSLVNAFNQKEGTAEEEISKSLIEALGNDSINTESACTFLIYMQLGMMKAVFSEISLSSNEDVLQGLNFSSKNQPRLADSIKQDEKIFIKLIETNKDIIPQIMHDIWNEYRDPELEWLYDWILACKSLINRDNFKEKFIELSYLLCNQLGLNENVLIPLYCQLISRSFNYIKYSN